MCSLPCSLPTVVGEQYLVQVYESDTEEEEGHSDEVFLSLTDRFLQEIDTNGKVRVRRSEVRGEVME